MRSVDIIAKKRDGGELSRAELEFLIQGYVEGRIPDYQVSAWAMAVYFKGMTAQETAALTDVMLRSGKTMELLGVTGPGGLGPSLVDKHSTGGVGDKTSLVLAPLAASLGLTVPMMAGRALGITGGTLDKLDSIPGYQTSLSETDFRRCLQNTGCVICGQTKELVPADRLLYALRDVTATVESIPLITASILSKKAAEGAQALVLDIKYGSGAFMKDRKDGEALARSLVDTGKALGLKAHALMTEMDEPLGRMVGNFLEVEEAMDMLEKPARVEAESPDLFTVTLALAARMALLGKKAASLSQAEKLCKEALLSGEAWKRFLADVKEQGGDVDKLLAMRGQYRARDSAFVKAAQDGFVARIDAGKIGHAATILGVGREKADDKVSPTAGIKLLHVHGDAVKQGEPLMQVWAKDAPSLAAGLPLLEDAVEYSKTASAPRVLLGRDID
jgi:pyrimidine-nucleoside phosphorylase